MVAENRRSVEYRRRHLPGYFTTRGIRKDVEFRTTPEAVYLEREEALRGPRTLTQVLCGDPLFGRSALDKEKTCENA
jgi:hypothetical protein